MDASASPSTPNEFGAKNWPVNWLPRAMVATLQDRFAAMYGSRFQSLIRSPREADIWSETWAAGLAGVGPQELRRGYDACLVDHPDWPPTLGQFRELCIRKPHPSHVPRIQAPRDTTDRSREMGRIFDMLGRRMNGGGRAS